MPLFYTDAAGAGSASMMSLLLPLVIMIALMYFLMIRPENKRKKKAQEMRDSLKKGDTITSIGGIVGKIVAVNAETIVIETSDDRVRMELKKWALSSNDSNPPDTGKKGKKAKEEEETPVIEEGSDNESK